MAVVCRLSLCLCAFVSLCSSFLCAHYGILRARGLALVAVGCLQHSVCRTACESEEGIAWGTILVVCRKEREPDLVRTTVRCSHPRLQRVKARSAVKASCGTPVERASQPKAGGRMKPPSAPSAPTTPPAAPTSF